MWHLMRHRRTGLAMLLLALLGAHASGTSVECPRTSSPSEHAGATLRQFADDSGDGVIYDDTEAALRLQKEGGKFSSKFFPASGNPQYTCAADFDKDGWTDFIGGSSDGSYLGFYRNLTADNQVTPAPAWSDPTYATAPKFERPGGAWIESTAADAYPNPPATGDGGGVTGCGDFNGDGNPDFLYILEQGNDGGRPFRADIFLGKGDGTFHSPYQLTGAASAASARDVLKDIRWDGNLEVTDYNGDGRLDFLFGAEDPAQINRGFVRVFLNDGGAGWTGSASKPTFTPGAYLVSNVDLGAAGINGVAWGDVTGDGHEDLLVVGISARPILMYPGLVSGGVSSAAQQITDSVWTGGGQILVLADFTLDGRLDLVMGTNGNGGQVFLWANDGSANPLSHAATQQISESFSDFDTGFIFDYDNDPDHTVDFMFADGNGAGYSVFANRVQSSYVACGEVASGTLDLGSLQNSEMVVTAGRLSPTRHLPSGTSVTFYMSNVAPESWAQAAPCTDDPSDYCVTFPDPVGQQVKWKALMCSDTTRSSTPSLSGVQVSIDYTPAEQHFRSGVVVHDGVAYVGAFRQPGDRGHFYALNANLTATYWDAATRLDARNDADRHVYTATSTGSQRLDFTTAGAASGDLQAVLNVASESQASSVVSWQRSARFGVSSSSRLGAVLRSTPAVLTPPGLPVWYAYAGSADKQLVEGFVQAHADRDLLILFGSKDGALHAIHNDPTNPADPRNGAEAWAFIPPAVASRLVSDQASGTVTAYPDGSPTVADVKLDDGALHTVAIVPMGNGGGSVFALDVTETIDETTGAVLGPTPLWQYTPGDALAGRGYAKPAVARVKIGGNERFIAILGTGIAADDTTAPYDKGRDVVALDIATGTPIWRFRARCPLTSNIVTAETDDEAEPGGPAIDGFIDRAIFADTCGYVYKLDPAVEHQISDADDGWLVGLGSIDAGDADPAGQQIRALYSVAGSALGGERPIVGTIGARPDASGRLVLFFGTGGLETFDVTRQNALFAIYADTGALRSILLGDCASGRCEKFYGGVVVTPDQVIATRAVDPEVGTGTCELGAASVDGFDLDSGEEFTSDFRVTTSASTVSSLYGDAGAVYFTSLDGDVVRLGTPRAGEAGDDSRTGHSGGMGAGDGGSATGGLGTASSLSLLGWRQVY